MNFRAFAAVSLLGSAWLCAGCFVYGESLLEPTGSGGAGGTGATGGSEPTTTTTTTATGGSTGQPCSAPEDCPEPSSPCMMRVCTGGTCATENLPPNTEITDPAPGDCRGVICDSAGGALEVEKSSDAADDMNGCTLDLCELGEPVHKPSAGAACGPGGADVCSANGDCVECIAGSDCASMVCKDEACAPASCNDGTKNGTETDEDCGGSCSTCATGLTCAVAADCKSGVCQNTICLPSCTDGAKNNAETDVDCGGGTCPACANGAGCGGGGDCQSKVCAAGACAAPTCSDGQMNGAETGTDCGGPACASCTLDHMVINEVDYDQPTTDSAEFVEIFNATGGAVSLASLKLVLVNGSGNAPYKTIDLASAGSIAAGQYLVVGAPGLPVAAGALKIDFAGATDQIQNGSPDGVALVDTAAGTVIDALSYEGGIAAADLSSLGLGVVSLVEGLAASAKDEANAGSLCRLPNSKDTNSAAADWALSATPTPGAPNVP